MNIGVSLEQLNAIADVYDYVNERGDDLKISFRKETDVVRDSYNSLESRKKINTSQALNVKAYPIDFNPTAKVLEKAGIKENCDFLCYVPIKYFDDYGILFNDIETIRTTLEYKAARYQVKEKNQTSIFGNEYLYIVFSAMKI